MVSVLEGQLSRTWYFLNQGRNHVINLYHDTITGVRSAMLDFNEIRGSTGNSSLLMDTKGHRIFFSVDNLPGYIEIKRSGWSGFTYACIINNARIPEATEVVADDQGDVFAVKIVGTTTTQDEHSEHLISWYIVQTTRLADGAITTIHRRFRDFAEYNSQVKQNFKGHHLRDMLPPLPEKPLKSLTDHKDPQFILDRQLKLETFLIAIVAVPHVAQMVCTKAFVGLMDRVKEYSVSFHVPQLGLSLIPYHTSNNQVAKSKASSQEAYAQDDYNTPVVVGSILKPDVCVGITPGDTISKINGVPVAGTNFQGIIARIKLLPRPILIHFISVIGGVAAGTTTTATAAEHADEAPRSSAHETMTTTDHESSPLDQGPRGKKPDLFDGHHHQQQQQQPFHHPSPVGKNQPQQPQQHQGPSQSEVTAAKQAELSEASRKALEALKQLDEGDDDLLFGKKKTEGNVSLFGASGGIGGRGGARRDVDEDLFGPVVKKAAASASASASASTSVPVVPSTPTPSPVPVPVASPPPVAAPVAPVSEGRKESETPVPAPVPVVERSIWDDDVIEIAAAPAPVPVPTPVVESEAEAEANPELVESSTPVVPEPPISKPVETAPEAPSSEEANVDVDVDVDVVVSEPPSEEKPHPEPPQAVAEPFSDVPEPSSNGNNNTDDDNTDNIASVQIDPFADDFVEEKAPEEAAAATVAPVVETTEAQPPAPPAPLGWDD